MEEDAQPHAVPMDKGQQQYATLLKTAISSHGQEVEDNRWI
jgi:hypothetical protein